ncbi:glycosyltransferase [Clostridium intestinale]|uniref:Glycosyltransferase n=1 Tax=Clostridium intestinale TaxID=36845 RepID=A0A7D7A2H6_9CLOT|nr:glycosyltransferase [Clostridium intestinale]QLY78760.1 glycosyltransferase [Clostridium intestinale]
MEKKIAFISCVNNEQLYDECVKYIENLTIPVGIKIELIPIRGAKSIMQGYNMGMKKTDAKYKVYLHQDTFIINKNFIQDILEIFETDNNIGMLGVIGSKVIPTNAIWWEAKKKYGKVYNNPHDNMTLLEFDEIENKYEKVQAIDGLIMITQHDIKWREDIFDGWDFYDLSQCVEFIKVGYNVVIPRQEEPWCLHDCGIINVGGNYERLRNIFIKEYSKDIFPLVSVLIPTYNRPQYLELALKSVLNQTYKNIEIIIGDDSDNEKTKNLIKINYLNRYSNILYYYNKINLGQFDNDIKLFNLSNGEFINYLMDDDLFREDKIEKMMSYFIEDFNNEISLVTSHRGIIDINGAYKGIYANTDKGINKNIIINGIEAGNYLIKEKINFIGEPTTVLFKKGNLIEPFGIFNKRKYGPNIDQASWLNLLYKGNLVYINEVLSYFRIHEGQQQNSFIAILEGYIDHAHKLLTCRKKGFLKDLDIYVKSLKNLISDINTFISSNIDENLNDKIQYEDLKKYIHLLKKELEKNLLEYKSKNNYKALPLVSILIPAYNQTNYLKEALESAINQTYPNIEIIIGDDSTNEEVKELIKPYLERYSNIVYFKNERDEMDYGYKNHVECYRRSNGEYINYLNHDDIFHPEKIERMMIYFSNNPDITLVTSVRQPIDERNNKLNLEGAFARLFEKDTVISGYDFSRYVVKNMVNCIGEPTTVLFKKKYIEYDKYGYINDNKFFNLNDLANWIKLMQYGDIVYITDALSYFRIHSNQNSIKPDIYVSGINEWKKLIDESYKMGILIDSKEYKSILYKWLENFYQQIRVFIDGDYCLNSSIKKELELSYKNTIEKIMSENYKKNYICPICGKEIEQFLPYRYKEHYTDSVYKFNIIGSDMRNFSCPECYSHDRVRHIVMYFNKLNIWNKNITKKDILHIAPEKVLRDIILKLEPNNYVCGDLYPIDNSILKIDITNISFRDNYFDFIICNHVLEHIEDDLKAMKELYRVLKKGGYAVLQTPYSTVIEKSFEDRKLITATDRKKFFGQSDHVRIYGKDFFDRLQNVGFSLKIIKSENLFSDEESKIHGFNNKEDLILVTKE